MKNRNLLWRGLLILAVTLICIALAYPPKKKINLGLDLQGGMHLVLQVHTEDALRAETDSDLARLLDQAKEQGAQGLTGRRTGDSTFMVSGSPEARDVASDIARKSLPRWESSSSEDGLVFTMNQQAVNEIQNGAVTQAVQTIDNRINQFGVTEPVIAPTSTGHRIVVQLPGVDDPERVRRLIKNTAFLEFRIVRYPKGGGGVSSREEILSNYGGQLPPDVEILEGDRRDDTPQHNIVGKSYYAVDKRRTVTGRDLRNASPGRGQFGNFVVEFTLTPDGSQTFGQLTGQNVGSGLAIVLDGRVITAPVVKSRITDRGQIEGNFDQQEAQDLSFVLKSGALPASITYLEERTVGPSLGRDSIRDGVRASLLAVGFTVVVMGLYYGVAGLLAVAALVLNVLILFGGMGAFHSTLTLPGIAGVILTIGMAVDANVLVFERIREELRNGKTVKAAINNGFDRVWMTIIDTHATALIAAVFLFAFGTGPVKGFAVTLVWGLVANIFASYFVSHFIFEWVLGKRQAASLSI